MQIVEIKRELEQDSTFTLTCDLLHTLPLF